MNDSEIVAEYLKKNQEQFVRVVQEFCQFINNTDGLTGDSKKQEFYQKGIIALLFLETMRSCKMSKQDMKEVLATTLKRVML